MRSYLFDVGNSSEGPIGMCVRVRAESAKKAVSLIQGLQYEIELSKFCDLPDGIEYANVYTNTSQITEEDITEDEIA